MVKLKQEIKKEFNTQLNKNEYKIVLTGYELNGINIPLDPNNRYYKKVQELILKGEVPEYQYTEKDVISYIKSEKIEVFKSKRKQLTNNIVITLTTGEELNGDEVSQSRLLRAFNLLDDTSTVNWIDANNNLVTLDKTKIQQSLTKATEEQSNIFVTYNKYRDQVNTATTQDELSEIKWD